MAKRRSRANTDYDDPNEALVSPPAPSCWLCERPLGQRVEWHHPVPKSRGGRSVVGVHPICHRALHANFTNAELARIGEDVAMLRGHEVLVRFLNWVAGKDPDFHAPTARRGRG
ncbi:hypothetical protein FHW96_000071 [Novosphingobium sp. SG751A]|uniref:HNH endonuclease n=1 Tax=Novosphingobium sp. SG751A TaxID=2587000 RepID=UPI001553E8A8|nr:HNH endonuclease [Novosphingobium sp. SG751A]NOW43944.1 hypothetical protein [Novosphingobium sp. SG751A]